MCGYPASFHGSEGNHEMVLCLLRFKVWKRRPGHSILVFSALIIVFFWSLIMNHCWIFSIHQLISIFFFTRLASFVHGKSPARLEHRLYLIAVLLERRHSYIKQRHLSRSYSSERASIYGTLKCTRHSLNLSWLWLKESLFVKFSWFLPKALPHQINNFRGS